MKNILPKVRRIGYIRNGIAGEVQRCGRFLRHRWKDACKTLVTRYVDNVENGEENSLRSVIINRILRKMSRNAVFYSIFTEYGFQIM